MVLIWVTYGCSKHVYDRSAAKILALTNVLDRSCYVDYQGYLGLPPLPRGPDSG